MSHIRAPLAIVAVVSLAAVAPAQGITELVSHETPGTLPGNGGSNWPELSRDGRFVAFQSEATNLVPGFAVASSHCYLADRQLGTLEFVDRAPGGGPATGASSQPQPSADGAFVLFASTAPELGGFGGATWDFFLLDRTLGTTTCLSSTPTDGTYHAAGPARMSSDARFVAMVLGTDVFGSSTEVWLLDRASGQRARASENAAGIAADMDSWDVDVSDDGRYVAFQCDAANLVASDGSSGADVFVKDMLTGAVEHTSVSVTGTAANQQSFRPRISADGRFVSFASYATNLVPSGHAGALVRDRLTGTTELVSVSPSGASANQFSFESSISDDGRIVVFSTNASNLSSEPDDFHGDCFLHDRATGATVCVSTWNGTSIPQDTSECAISGDGRILAFRAVQGTPAVDQVLVHDPSVGRLRVLCPGTNFACPCANGGQPGSGCENADGTGGALLASTGNPSILTDTWNLVVTGMRANCSLVFIQGTAVAGGGTLGQPFGDGLRCASGAVVRLAARTASAGNATLGPASGDAPIHVLGGVSGGTGARVYQVFYRDVTPGYCTPAGFNLSNGLEASWGY